MLSLMANCMLRNFYTALSYGLISGSSVRFVLINISMTWAKAQNYCRTHYTDLASVRNMTENQEVKKLVSSGQKFWIGLFRDTWKWLDGSNSSFRYWKMGEPNNKCLKEACVAADFNHSGQWEDFNCDYKRAFICYTGKPWLSLPLNVKLGWLYRYSRDKIRVHSHAGNTAVLWAKCGHQQYSAISHFSSANSNMTIWTKFHGSPKCWDIWP